MQGKSSNRGSHSQVQSMTALCPPPGRKASNARGKNTPTRQEYRLGVFKKLDLTALNLLYYYVTARRRRRITVGDNLFSSPKATETHLLRPAQHSCLLGARRAVSCSPITSSTLIVMPNTSSGSTSVVSRTGFGRASKTKDLPHIPLLVLDSSGTIKHLNEPAHRTLEYSADAPVNSCFFSHVHGHNLRRVMRDLALMVSHRKQRARWLLRLRTGNGRWRWYRLFARNHLDQENGGIRIRLRPL